MLITNCVSPFGGFNDSGRGSTCLQIMQIQVYAHQQFPQLKSAVQLYAMEHICFDLVWSPVKLY